MHMPYFYFGTEDDDDKISRERDDESPNLEMHCLVSETGTFDEYALDNGMRFGKQGVCETRDMTNRRSPSVPKLE
ncbi:13772_t:CDS:2, partial [Acaulospora morrowiae]